MKKNLILKTAINEITLNDLVSKLLNSDSLSIALCNANSVVRAYRNDAHETALNILRNNLPLLESISQKILQEEVIEGEDLKTLLAESKMPA